MLGLLSAIGIAIDGDDLGVVDEAVDQGNKAVCRRGIYDNMKTAVSTVFVGKKRDYNRRFQRSRRPLPGSGT